MSEFIEVEYLYDVNGVPTVRLQKTEYEVWAFDKHFAWYKGDPSEEAIIEILIALNKGVLD